MSKIWKNLNSLRVRFALGFSLLFTFFLAAALIFIYISFAKFRKEEFLTRLKEKAITTYKLLIEEDEIDSSLLRKIDKNIPNSNAQQVMIFKDSNFIYSSSDEKKIQYSASLFDKIKKKNELFTTQGNNEVIGLYMQKNQAKYTILAFGFDKYGFRKMVFLKWVMIIVYCVGVVIGWIVTYFFVKQIIKPLDLLKTNLKNINYNNLDARLPETGQGEEVNSLSVDFNQMLGRLEQSFSFQKDFVHYASHELRTPIAAMVGVTENAMNNGMTSDQHHEVLNQLLHQQKNLTNLTNSLLLLSGNKINSNGHEYPMIRLDELIFRSVEITKNLFPEAQIEVILEGELSNENLLLIRANEPLILMAFNNLLKNALQYSTDNRVGVLIKITETSKQVIFMNKGDEFTIEEKERLFTPFYRASNSATVKGHGLGLALVKQIVQLHDAAISYSYEKRSNTFTITFV